MTSPSKRITQVSIYLAQSFIISDWHWTLHLLFCRSLPIWALAIWPLGGGVHWRSPAHMQWKADLHALWWQQRVLECYAGEGLCQVSSLPVCSISGTHAYAWMISASLCLPVVQWSEHKHQRVMWLPFFFFIWSLEKSRSWSEVIMSGHVWSKFIIV